MAVVFELGAARICQGVEQFCENCNSYCFTYLHTHENVIVTTLLGNPKERIVQGNPNTCIKVKLCLFFIYSGSRNIFWQN